MKPAYTLFVKTGPSCNAGCLSCPSGRKQPGDTEKIPLMEPEIFGRILDKVQAEARIITVVLHYYNEPTLNPHMPKVIKQAKDRGIETRMSTNGSRPDKLRACYMEGIDNLIFSVSGFTQAVHSRSHKGVDIEEVKLSMSEIAALRNSHFPKNYIKAGWHDYLYNRHEALLMRDFCESRGIHFDSYQTSVLPLFPVTKAFYQARNGGIKQEHPAERDLLTKLPKAAQLCADRAHWECIYQNGMFAVDGNGDVSICPADIANEDNPNIAGNIFKTTLKEIGRWRKTCAWCLRCKAVGAHVYGMQKYRTPINWRTELFRKAEDTYRFLGVGARFPGLSKRLGSMFYERPRNAV